MRGDPGSAKIADRVRDLRNRASLSQRELADYADIAKKTVERIEGGTENPTLFMLIQLATALDMTASELIVEFTDDDLPLGRHPHSATAARRERQQNSSPRSA